MSPTYMSPYVGHPGVSIISNHVQSSPCESLQFGVLPSHGDVGLAVGTTGSVGKGVCGGYVGNGVDGARVIVGGYEG